MEEDPIEQRLEVANIHLSSHAKVELRRSARSLRMENSSAAEFALYFARWKEFVEDIEGCYLGESTEYRWELSSRHFIDMMLSQSDAETKNEVSDWLRFWDARFVKATRQVAQLIDRTCDGGWWCYRIPLRYGKYLGRTLPITDE